MAFDQQRSTPNGNGTLPTPANRVNGGNAPQARRKEIWQADSFLNIHLRARDGSTRKLGQVPLKLSNAGEADIHHFLLAGGDKELQAKREKALLNRIVLDWRLAERDEGRAFDLPDDEEVEALAGNATAPTPAPVAPQEPAGDASAPADAPATERKARATKG